MKRVLLLVIAGCGATTTGPVTPAEDAAPLSRAADEQMVRVPAGRYVAGSTPEERQVAYDDYNLTSGEDTARERGWFDREEDRHVAELPAFAIDLLPVTNAQYAELVRAGGAPAPTMDEATWTKLGLQQPWSEAERHVWKDGVPPPGREDHPVVLVNHDEAAAYCDRRRVRARRARQRGPDVPVGQHVGRLEARQWRRRRARHRAGRQLPGREEPGGRPRSRRQRLPVDVDAVAAGRRRERARADREGLRLGGLGRRRARRVATRPPAHAAPHHHRLPLRRRRVMTPALIVHGGAGAIAAEREEPARLGCLAAALAGLRVLASGGRALDAVQAAVRVLEDDPLFNAGTGSVLSREETIEVDASIMDGATLKIGAVAAVPDLPDAVALARAILDDGEHIVLAGPAAWTFARERGFSPAAPGAMITERARQRLAEERARRAGGPPPSEREGGTVGAAAIDASGHVAAATSTGGIVFKRPGRVGDSPLPGCGTWADDAGGAASATGDGEQIIRVTLTRMLVERLVAGASAGEAARAAIDDLVKRTGGSAGVICVDRAGRLGATHASETMSCAGGVVEDGAIRAEAWVRPRELEDLHAIVRAAPIR